MNTVAQSTLDELLEGNARFRAEQGTLGPVSVSEREHLAKGQTPIAAVIACCDSRVSPEVIFDQPLGRLFVSRPPGNVASDGAKWMLEIAIEELKVPLVIVMGHTECLAVGQILAGQLTGPGGVLRLQISSAVSHAKSIRPVDLYRESVIQNALATSEKLSMESHELRMAMQRGTTSLVTMLYDVHTGSASVVTPRS